MSMQSNDFVSEFQALPETEQRAVVAEILRLTAHWDNEHVTDDELIRSADDLFAEMDRREDTDVD